MGNSVIEGQQTVKDFYSKLIEEEFYVFYNFRGSATFSNCLEFEARNVINRWKKEYIIHEETLKIVRIGFVSSYIFKISVVGAPKTVNDLTITNYINNVETI